MQLVYTLVFILMMCGFVDIFHIKLAEVVEPPGKEEKEETLADMEKKSKKKLISMKDQHKSIVETMNVIGSKDPQKGWETFLRVSALSGCVGASIGSVCDNFMLAIVLAVAFLIMPSFYMQYRKRAHEKQLHDQMQSAVAIMTNAYMMYHDIGGAAAEALKTSDEPFKNILTHFMNRLATNTNATEALSEMRGMVDDHYWREWIDLMIQCQTNSALDGMLAPIPETMSKQSQMQAQWDTLSQRIWLEHFAFAGLSIGSIFLILLLNKDWGKMLVTHPVGKLIVALNVLAVFVSTLYAYKVNRPIYAEV